MMNDSVKSFFTSVEKGFNIAGCIPLVSFFSGTIRAFAGKIQAFVGGIFTMIGAICFSMTHRQKWSDVTQFGSEMVLHGVLNTLRGYGEAALCVSTLVGNIFLLFPNLAKENEFNPYFTYGQFTDPEPVQNCCF